MKESAKGRFFEKNTKNTAKSPNLQQTQAPVMLTIALIVVRLLYLSLFLVWIVVVLEVIVRLYWRWW